MNKHVVHLVMIVLAVLAALYAVYLGIGQPHAYAEASYYVLLAILLVVATTVDVKS